MKKLILAALTLASVHAVAADLSFNNLGLRYQYLDFNCDSSCDAGGVAGSLEFNERFFGELDYQKYSGADLTYVGLGLRHAISDQTAFYGTVGAVRLDIGESLTEGYVSFGVRSMMTENFEGDAAIRYIVESESDPSVRLTGTYFFTDSVGGQAFLEGSDGLFGGGLGLRINF